MSAPNIRWSAVHPRACGERMLTNLDLLSSNGSSPRLRGTLGQQHHEAPADRFIPAPAGNATSPAARRRATTVHPRACGERRVAVFARRANAGSSPRLRGTRLWGQITSFENRFIPAPAGNAATCSPSVAPVSVHPRACGERAGGKKHALVAAGSSPRLRGTRSPSALPAACGRFIPAPAGNARSLARKLPGTSVHPRACGERGEALEVVHGHVRFIPAPAGNAA